MQTEYVYRYMSKEEFVDVIKNHRLTLKYPGNWPDKLEAFFLKIFETEEACVELIRKYQNIYPNYSEMDIKSDFQIISALLVRARCQCWTKNKDDMRMWTERPNETICISIKRETFERMGIKHSVVSYKPEITIDGILDSFVSAERWVPKLIAEKKKDDFEYENEVRIYKLPIDCDFRGCGIIADSLSDYLTQNYRWLKDRFKQEDEKIEFNPRDICEVLIHPKASIEFIEEIQKLCDDYLQSDMRVESSKLLG